jgi:hypothetical protein
MKTAISVFGRGHCEHHTPLDKSTSRKTAICMERVGVLYNVISSRVFSEESPEAFNMFGYLRDNISLSFFSVM